MNPADFVKPTIEYVELLPVLVVFGAACLGVLLEAFMPRRGRFTTQAVVAGVAVLGALAATIYVAQGLDGHSVDDSVVARGLIAADGTFAIDGPTVFLWGLVLLLALAGVVLFAERRLENGRSGFAGQAASLPGSEAEREAAERGLDHSEVFPLLMFAVAGMLLFPAANDLLMLFIALEVLSLPLYLLCGLARRRRLLSQEAAMKYFLLGAFSSGFLLYGIALIYGYTGSMEYAQIDVAIQGSITNTTMLLIGLGLVLVGMFFKIGAVPFQSWTPDVYQGAPTAVTAFMSAATKVAAFGALLRLLYVAFGAERASWQPLLWVVAILSMVIGAVLAIAQTDVKRMLAYSSIAHTGFLLTGVLGLTSTTSRADGQLSSLTGVLFYLVTYGFITLGAFAVVSMVRDATGETTDLRRWAGLGKSDPVVAGIFTLFLLAMAGIPLTSGFTGKWALFAAAASAGAWPVVVVAVLTSAVAAFFYLRVIRLMYFTAPEGDGPSVTVPSLLTSATVAVGVGVTLVLGIVPGPVLDLAARAGEFIR